MRVEYRYLRIRSHERVRTTVYKGIDFVFGGQAREELDVVLRDAGPYGRQRREPRESRPEMSLHRVDGNDTTAKPVERARRE
jgi:hypothetical protein